MGLNYYVIDTETTGLKAGYQEMTEIGVIRCKDRVQLHRKIKCENPERVSYDALKITKKTMDDIVNGHNKMDVVLETNKFFEEDGQQRSARCIVAHNAPFDRRFLHALWESCGMEFPADLWLDTISLTKEFVKISDPATLNITKTATGKISKMLHAACDLVGVNKLSEAHNSKVDSRNTYLLWKKLTEEKNIDHLPFHKTFIHSLKKNDILDVDDLDMSDVMDV